MQAEEENPETTGRIINRLRAKFPAGESFIIKLKGGEEMKKKRKGSEEELDLVNIPPFFLEAIRDLYPPEEQREFIRLFKEEQSRRKEDEDRFLDELIESLS